MGNTSVNRIFNWVVMGMAILFLLPSVSAENYCDFTNYKEECMKLIDYPLPFFIKEKIVEVLFYDNEIPKHEEVFNFNNNQVVSLDRKSDGVIKDAYLKLLPVSPSVLIDDKLYLTDKGKVVAKYNHRFELPSGTQSGDCRTTYEFTDQFSDVNVYINDIKIGNGVINSFSEINLIHDSTADVNAEYEIWAEYLVGHYYENRYCADWDYDEDGRKYCDDWEYECKFGYHEREKDRLVLTDNKKYYFFKREPLINFEVLDKYYDTIYGSLIANNYSSFELNFDNAFLKQFNYFYSLEFNDDNLITIKVNEKEKIENQNLIYEKANETFNFNVKNSECELTLRDHFFETINNCDLDFEEKEKIKFGNYEKNDEPLIALAKLVAFAFFVYLTFKISKNYGGKNG